MSVVDVIETMENPYKYDEFIIKSIELGFVHKYQEIHYYQVVGCIKGLMSKLDITAAEAYEIFRMGGLNTKESNINAVIIPQGKSSCCGGGEVR